MNSYTQNIKIYRPQGQIQPRVFQTPGVYEPGVLITQPNIYNPQNLNTTPEDEKRGSFTPLLIIFIVVLLIIAVALLYAFRDKVFKKGKVLASAPPDEQSQAGYGTYGPASYGLCKTQSGLCSDPGSQTVTQQCIPNPITGLGCLDENGNQTFSPKVSNQNCNVPCRQFKFVETTRNPNLANKDAGTYDSICKYYPSGQNENGVIQPNYNDIISYPCLPSNTKIGQYYVKKDTCLPNDKLGTNECSVTCGEIDFLPNGFSVPPTEDPNSVLFVPVCNIDPTINGNYKKPLKSRHFYLNTFPWEIAFNLPDNGVKIGKGFVIKNLIDPITGNIDLNSFEIFPPYTSPIKYVDGVSTLITDDSELISLSVITVEQLLDLDSNLYTYQSCQIENPRPFCSKYYLYNRTQFTPNIGVNETTLNTKPSLDPVISSFRNIDNGQYYSSRNCYYNDYNSSATRFETPYDFTHIPSPLTDYYTGGYSGYGIGMFGYINDELTCLSSITIPSQESPDQDGAYNVPPSNGLCLGLNPVDNSVAVPDDDLITTNCFPLDTSNLNYLPDNLPYNTDYPPTSGIFNTCNTQIAYTQGPVGKEGILSICRYMPNNEDITISTIVSDPLYNLPNKFKQLFGYYIRMGVTDSTDSYYLSLQNTPCNCSTSDVATCSFAPNINPNEPLGNCGGNPNNIGIGPIPTMLIYNGQTTDDLSGGVYWERPGCDSYLMDAVNSLQIIISPREYDSINDRLECDILSIFMSSYNGYLSYQYDNTLSPTYAELVYIPVNAGDINPDDYKYYNNTSTFPIATKGKFAIECNSPSSPFTSYSILAYNTVSNDYDLPVRVPIFNGTGPLNISNYLELNTSAPVVITLYNINGNPTLDPSIDAFKDSNLIPFNPYYIKNIDNKYEAQPLVVEESGGLYPNQNLYNTVVSQQTTVCNVNIQTCNLFCSY